MPIVRHIMMCSACSSTYHLECLAEDWMLESASAGPAAAAAVAAEAAGQGGGGVERFGGVPEEGLCPCCGHRHTWMGLLSSMQTIGWGNKPRRRKGCAPGVR
jgi:hypothetical protein